VLLPPGTRLGHYEIVSLLGAGGMGQVYRAQDTRLSRDVALKVLTPDAAGDVQSRARFTAEARAIAQLSHPHICTLFDVGESDSTAFLVMELLHGQTLAERLRGGALPLSEALTIGMQLAEAIAGAHRRGIVHRDIKPGNIMLTKTGAKLLDFGLAKLRQSAPVLPERRGEDLTTQAGGTAAGTILGTIHYMSPEQVEGRSADTRSDIWALGVVMQEMLTGVRPFGGDTPASVLSSILKDTPASLSSLRPLTPAPLDHVVERCLAKSPDERWQDAGDVKWELQWIASRLNADVTPALGRPTSGRIAWLVGAVSVVVALLTGAAWWRAGASEAVLPRRTFALAPPQHVRITGGTALSPDGRWFAFVGQGAEGPPSMWIRSIDTGTSRPLADTDDPAFPFWSPQADALGFFAAGKLKTISLGGGPPKVLANASAARGGSWGADGTILYVADTNSPVLRISEKGSTPQAVTQVQYPRGHIGHRWPIVVDTDHFLFTVQSTQADVTGIYLGTLSSGTSVRLVPQFSNSVYAEHRLLYVTDGTIVARTLDVAAGTVGESVEVAGPIAFTGGLGWGAFSASAQLLAYPPGVGATATVSLQLFNRTGTPVGMLGAGSELINYNGYYPQFSPDGRKVVLSAFPSTTADLWVVDIERGVSSRVTFDPATEFSAVWSPDGTELVYAWNRKGFYNMYRQSVSTLGDARLIAEAVSHQYPTDWSSDGRTIVFTNIDPKTQADIWVRPVDGGPDTPVLAAPFNEYAARLSPNGQWLAYASDESGRVEVYVQRYPSGRDKMPVSTSGGTHPQWSGDGRELFYLAADRKLNAVAITEGPPFAVGRPQKLFDVPVDMSIGSMHATHFSARPDRERFLLGVTAISQTSADVVFNWTQGLKSLR
jgi:eukaryotic-like serine/threonine-protein kinase